MAFYDENGNEVEGVLAPDEAKALQEQIQTKESELSKLQQKDNNFSEFRAKTKEEKEELVKGWDEEKQILMSELDDLKGRVDSRDEAMMEKLTEAKTSLLKKVAGDDEDLQKEIQAEYDRMGEPLTPDQIGDQYDAARILVERRKERSSAINPVNYFVPSTTGPSVGGNKKNAADTKAGKELAKSLGLTLEEPKK